MANIQICPACGASNPADHRYCMQCVQALSLSVPSDEEAQSSQDEEQLLAPKQQSQPEPARPSIKIVRPSNRRKFLVSLLGSGAILAAGSLVLPQLARHVWVAAHTRRYPYNIWDHLTAVGFSSDLDYMAMIKIGEYANPQAELYIWDYQQQRMSTLPTGPFGYNEPVWSPDKKYLLIHANSNVASNTLDLWDMQTQQKIQTHDYKDVRSSHAIHWSPDGSQIAYIGTDIFVVLSAIQLTPLFSLKLHEGSFIDDFAWSPDGQRVAFLCGKILGLDWSVQVWDLRTRRIESEIGFRGVRDSFRATLAWSPDGAHIAVIAHGQLVIIQASDASASYGLGEANDGGLLAWSPDGRYLAVAASKRDFLVPESSFGVWDIVERKRVRVFNNSSAVSSLPSALTWTKDGKYIRVIVRSYQQENWDWY